MAQGVTVASKDMTYVVREVILIVAGILIAFGLNAWWQGRSARTTETVYLTRLETDLHTAEVELEEKIESHREKVELLQHVVALLGAGPSQARADSVAALGAEVTVYTLLSESVRAYDELVNAGNVELLTSGAIRAALQDYAYEREVNQDWDEYQGDFSIQVVEPAVLERLPIRIRDEAANSFAPPPFEALALFDDLVFWNLVRFRLDNELGVLDARQELLRSVGEAYRLVVEELRQRDR
jgi:hypothetical protein